MKTVQLILPSSIEDEMWRTLDLPTSATRGPRQILLAPGALVMAREVDVVGSTEAQGRAATLNALAIEIATPIEGCVCALAPASNGRRVAYVMERTTLGDLMNLARTRGFAPDAVVPDFAFLPVPEGDAVVTAQRSDWLVRDRGAPFACQADLLPQLLGGRAAQEIDFEAALRSFVANGRQALLGNLLSSLSTVDKTERRPLPVLAATAASVAIAIFAALPWLEASQLNSATARLRAETEQVARTALRGANRIVNPIAQLREASLPREQAVVGLQNAVAVVEGLARSPGVAIARLSYDGEAVRAHVGMPTTSLLQPLRDHLAAKGLHLVETPGFSEPNSIPVELTVTAAP